MAELRLEELNATNIVAANNLSLKPGQEQFIAPVTYAAEFSVVIPEAAWQRVALLGDRVVGFIHGNFDPENPHEEFRACIWRINVDADVQGRGIGRFLASALAEEAKRRGVVAFSSGNHAQAIAYAGRLQDVPTVIIMPEDAPAMKVAADFMNGV